MKHLIARTLTSLMLAVVGLAVTAPAQSTQVIKANIPFEFNFGGQTFQAGDYSLAQPLQNVLVLHDSRGHAIAQVLTVGIEPRTPVAAPKLTFYSSEGQRILTEVSQQGYASGLQLHQAKHRAIIAKHHSTEAREAAEGSQP